MSDGNDEIRLWLDDDTVNRSAPDGWTQVVTAGDAIELLETGRVVELSLDHDLGDDDRFGTGGKVVDFLCERSFNDAPLWPRDGITLHTANGYGRDSMARAIERYAPKDVRVHRGMNGNGQPRFTFEVPE